MYRNRSLTILRLVLGVMVGGYSLALILRGDKHLPLVVLGVSELLAAILFLLPRTSHIGGVWLIVVFALAALLHVSHGEYDLGFLAAYAAAAFAVISNQRPV